MILQDPETPFIAGILLDPWMYTVKDLPLQRPILTIQADIFHWRCKFFETPFLHTAYSSKFYYSKSRRYSRSSQSDSNIISTGKFRCSTWYTPPRSQWFVAHCALYHVHVEGIWESKPVRRSCSVWCRGVAVPEKSADRTVCRGWRVSSWLRACWQGTRTVWKRGCRLSECQNPNELGGYSIKT